MSIALSTSAMKGHVGTSGYMMRRPSIADPCSRGGKGKDTRLGKRSREVGYLCCASSLLKRLLSIVASPTSLRSFSCLVFVTSRVEPVGNQWLGARTFHGWRTLCIASPLISPSTTHVVDWKARCSAVSKHGYVRIGMLELAPL